ncbi:MAG: hypothetical protein ACREUU_08680, partial [Gammaproteobacteria bacterium]
MNTSQPRWIALINLSLTAGLLSACVSSAPTPTATVAPTSAESALTPSLDQESIYPALSDVL